MVKPARNLVKLVCVFHKTKAAKEEFQGGGSTTTPLLRALLDWRREQQSRQDLPSEEAITQGSIKVLILVVPEKMVSMMAREVHVNESENAKSSPGVLQTCIEGLCTNCYQSTEQSSHVRIFTCRNPFSSRVRMPRLPKPHYST